MQHNVLVRPVAALMRRLRLRSKLALVATAALWPLPLLWLMPELSLMVAPVAAVLMVWLLWGLDASLRTDLRQIIDVMEQTTSGNLRASLRVHGRDEKADLTRLLDRMTGSLSAMVAEVRSNSALVAHAGQSLASGNRDLADRTEQQAANLEQTSASVQELASTVQRNAGTALEVDRQAAEVRSVAESGAQAMTAAVAALWPRIMKTGSMRIEP